jgi:hypothetical protein
MWCYIVKRVIPRFRNAENERLNVTLTSDTLAACCLQFFPSSGGKFWACNFTTDSNHIPGRSQWPRGRRSTAARLLRCWVRISPGGMDICCVCCVLSSRGLCEGLITRPEVSYRLWRLGVCDLDPSWMRWPWPSGGGGSSCANNVTEHNITQHNIIISPTYTYYYWTLYNLCSWESVRR